MSGAGWGIAVRATAAVPSTRVTVPAAGAWAAAGATGPSVRLATTAAPASIRVMVPMSLLDCYVIVTAGARRISRRKAMKL